jgi:hypothetical protein
MIIIMLQWKEMIEEWGLITIMYLPIRSWREMARVGGASRGWVRWEI